MCFVIYFLGIKLSVYSEGFFTFIRLRDFTLRTFFWFEYIHVFRVFGAFLHVYIHVYIYVYVSDLGLLFLCMGVVFYLWGKRIRWLRDRHPPTQHTHTHVYLVRHFPYLGVVTHLVSVCVLLQRAFTSDKPACSLRFAFSILKFTYRS